MKTNNFAHRYTAWLFHYCYLVCLLATLVAITGSYYTVKLYKNLRTDIEELLPANAPSVRDLKLAQSRVTVLNHLEIVIQSSDVEAAKRFQIDLARELRKIPSTVAGKVKEGIHEERAFFERNKPLYVDVKDWAQIYKYVKGKIGRQAFDLGLGDDSEEKFDLEQLEQKYKSRSSVFAKFKDDLFQSEDGKTRFIIVFLPGKVTDIKVNQALSEAAKETIAKLDLKSYAPDLQVGLGGDVQNIVEEHHGLVHDLISSFVIVTILVTLVLWIFFRSVSGVLGLSLALFVGVAIAFGLSFFAVGYLNANTAFLGSIVIGNGINFGVILLGRYQEELQGGHHPQEAMATAIGGTFHATAAAALAAGLAYGSLIITGFRGFNQFGIIGFIGMLFCWIAAYITLPAFIFSWERPRSVAKQLKRTASLPVMGSVARWVETYFLWITYTSLVMAAVAFVGLAKLSNHSIESDLTKLRNKESLLHGSGYWGKKVDDIFGRTLTPTMVLTNSAADTKKVYLRLKEIHAREGAHSPFSQLSIVEDLLPDHQSRKLAIMESTRKLLSPKVREKLSSNEKQKIAQLLPDPPPKTLDAKDLPPDLVGPFREASGKIGTIVHVYPRLNTADESKGESSSGTWDGEEVIRYTALLREAIGDTGVSAVIAGQPPVSADMLSSIGHDGPKATICAFLLVVLLVLVMFPNLKHSSAIVASLLFGVLLMLGTMGYMKWKINFLNFIALPITFGIGVDYAVNIFGRYREEVRRGTRSMGRVIRSTGGSVVLSSVTTIIGYSSLLLSGSQAFVSFGRIAVLGEFACIFAAVICLPAVWLSLKRSPT